MEPQEYRTGYPGDRYWRLPYYQTTQTAKIRRLLKAHNYPHSGPVSSFQHMLQHIARSLPAYEKCKTAELSRFAQQRGLIDADETDRKQLMQALRHADDYPRFDRIFALPPELRASTYRLYCADFADEPLTMPAWPPLARANRQLRDEMLPIFYSECTFTVGMQTDSAGDASRVLRMTRDTTLFFKSLSPEHLAHVQKLDVTLESWRPPLNVHAFAMRVVVPRNAKLGTVRADVRRGRGSHPDRKEVHPWTREEVSDDYYRELERRVVRFLERIQEREQGENHLLIADVYGLRSLLEAFFQNR